MHQLGQHATENNDRVEKTRTVAVHAHAATVRGLGSDADPLGGHRGTSATVMGVLDAEQTRHRLVHVGVAHRAGDVGR